jgi:NitT/TauT family transport system substrate-binding protein
VLVCVLMLSLLAGCAPAAPQAAPAATQPTAAPAATQPTAAPAAQPATLTRVVQALPVNSFGYLPLYIADDRGFFRDEGLDVERPIMAPNAAVAGLVNGDVDIAVAGSGVRAAMQGAPLKAFLYSFNATLYELVGAPDIRTMDDLRGKAVGTTAPGATEEVGTNILLRQAGLDPSRDVTYVLVPAGSQLPSLLSGAVQAMMVNVDLSAMAQDQGLHAVKTAEEVARVMPQPFSGYVVSTDTLRNRPEVVRAYLRAYLKAMQFVKTNPREAVAVIARVLDLEPRVAEMAVSRSTPAINPDDLGGASEEGLRLDIENGLRALQGQASVTELDDLVDFTLLRQAQREIGMPCKTGYQCK